MYDVNDTYAAAVTIKNAAGVAVNAATVALTITQPDGSTLTPTITNPPATTGLYTYDFVITQAGRHSLRWTSTTPNTAFTDSFDADAAASAIVSLADALEHLNMKNDDTAANQKRNEELRLIIDAASEWVENRVGPVARRIVTEVVSGRGGDLILSHAPVISLTTVTSANGYTSTYDVAGMYLNGPAGIITYGATALAWTSPVTVEYVVGRAIVPAAIRLATLVMVKAMWETQRGATPLPIPGVDETEQLPGMGIAVWRAEQMLAPYLLAPSVA